MAKPNWITISQNSGESGVTIITVEASSYSGLTNRTGQLTISSVHTTAQTVVNLSQKAREAITIQFSPSTAVVSSTGGTYTVDIISNGEWSLSASSWINLSKTSGSGNDTLSYTVYENKFFPREGEIIGTTIDSSSTFTITQNAESNPYLSQYFTIKVTGGSVVPDTDKIIWKNRTSDYNNGLTIQYSKDSGATWTSITSSTGGTPITVNIGDVVVFKGSNNSYKNATFSGTTCSYVVEGNIMSLFYGDNFSGKTEFPSRYETYALGGLFENSIELMGAEHLVLPSTRATPWCYANMFKGCVNLPIAPELPATVIDTNCYENMFSGCSNLRTVPSVLPATNLGSGSYCYGDMFAGCTSLTTAPELPATILSLACYNNMFGGCTSLVTAPSILPARELPKPSTTNGCYQFMFQGCTSLATAPELPATSLGPSCYKAMFRGCTSLTTAPELPATTLEGSCYNAMFSGCTSLTTAPELPATTLAGGCYAHMFQDCTSLTTAPELPATTLAGSCYRAMFQGCTSLTTAPTSIGTSATTLTTNCYQDMFNGCVALTTAPELPATTLASSCYTSMFSGCTSLVTAPSILPATTLADSCYREMFRGCTSLTSAPELPATTLATSCYLRMFYACSSLTTAPELPATTLAYYSCYAEMFVNCSSLNYIKCLATDLSGSYCTSSWVLGVSPTGTFVKNPSMIFWTTGINGIPNGWSVIDDGNILVVPSSLSVPASGSSYTLTITSNGAWSAVTPSWITLSSSYGTGNTTITATVANNPSSAIRTDNITFNTIDSIAIVSVTQDREEVIISVSPTSISVPASGDSYTLDITSNGAWSAVTPSWITLSSSYGTGNTTITATVANNPSSVIRAANITFNTIDNTATVSVSQSGGTPQPYENQYLTFVIKSDGNINWRKSAAGDGRVIEYSKDSGSTWTSIRATSQGTVIPVVSGDTVLFRGNNESYGYDVSSFYGTTCQFDVEGNIMSLVYGDDFEGKIEFSSGSTHNLYTFFDYCSGLTSAENLILPATALTQQCYQGMFNGCTSLTTAPELPATTLANYCYASMFSGCTSLVTAPEILANVVASGCCNAMFYSCTTLTTAPSILPATALTNSCYYGMFQGCTSLTTAPELPATTLGSDCYNRMFERCTALVNVPSILPATTLANNCYNSMFSRCTSLTTAPELPATTLANYCYNSMFYSCTTLNYIKCLATNIFANNCTGNWVRGVSSTGTFVKNPSMTSWTTGNNGIPSGWTVEDDT